MAETTLAPAQQKREFDGQQYILTTINYTEEAAKGDEAYYKEQGKKSKIIEEGIFWLVYTKIGQ